jgi:hypothetical protein
LRGALPKYKDTIRDQKNPKTTMLTSGRLAGGLVGPGHESKVRKWRGKEAPSRLVNVFRKWTAGDAERIDHDEQVAADEIDRPVC